MKPYDKILSKVSPTFFKRIQYREYFNNNRTLIDSYLASAELHNVKYIYLPEKIHFHIEYIYTYPFKGKISWQIVVLTTKGKTFSYNAPLDEIITSLIINNFNFEEINYTSSPFYKKLFIAAVGKDIYETIRANIK